MIEGTGRHDPDVALRLHPEKVLWREVQGEVVALSLGSSQYVSVNDSGSELWELLAAGATPRQLTRVLVERWDLAEWQAERDIEAFLDQLTRAGLLEA